MEPGVRHLHHGDAGTTESPTEILQETIMIWTGWRVAGQHAAGFQGRPKNRLDEETVQIMDGVGINLVSRLGEKSFEAASAVTAVAAGWSYYC